MNFFISFTVTVIFMGLIFIGLYYVGGSALGWVTADWLIGFFSALWLLFIVIVPWNAYFKAKEVLDEAAISKRNDIVVIEESLRYVKKVTQVALMVSLALHIISAGVLYYIATSGISVTGYYAAIVCLLFTFLRPAVRFYNYLQKRLNAIREEFRYPREDINSLLEDITQIKQDVAFILAELSDKEGETSWRNAISQYCEKNDKVVSKIQSHLAKNETQLSHEVDKLTQSHNALVTRMVDNAQVLESIKVIGRFFKGL